MKIDSKQLTIFFEWLTCGYDKKAYVEIKLMGIVDTEVYKKVKKCGIDNNIITKKNCQFFIQTLKELEIIMNYDNCFILKNCKMCYSISPKYYVNREISGKYKNMKGVDMLFLDIETAKHENIKEGTEFLLDVFVDSVMKRLRPYKLKNPMIVKSGAGIHVLYKLKRKPFNEKRKCGYKQLINTLESLNTEFIKIDHCVDLSRCIGLPESLNIKRNKQVKVLKMAEKPYINDFYIQSKKKPQINSVIDNSNIPTDIRQSDEYKILVHPNLDEAIGRIHNYILLALKLLLIKKGYKNNDPLLEELEYEINVVTNSNHVLDLDIGVEGKKYNMFIVKRWKELHKDWCEKYNI